MNVSVRQARVLLVGLGVITGCSVSGSRPEFYNGVDLSYVNEMEDCGAVFSEGGEPRDPFVMMREQGANLVRARLWNNPTWTDYSNLTDVTKTLQRARQEGMATLLDFHYSDDWADPGSQHPPASWSGIDDVQVLADLLHDYTRDVLLDLESEDALPDLVQVGNETNGGLVKDDPGIEWERDSMLFNAGIAAVREVAEETEHDIKVILHVAQPENTGSWFEGATAAGVTDFDVIGISYYPQWSRFSIEQLGSTVGYLRREFGKSVMVLETAYPWTNESSGDSADNILDQGLRSHPVSVDGQRDFMTDLTQTVMNNGGQGVVYWEPAWISTGCSTRWGVGSHWENATLFDFTGEVHAGIDYLSYPYTRPSWLVDGVVEEDYGSALSEDAEGDASGGVDQLDLRRLFARATPDSYYLALSVTGDLRQAFAGGFQLYIDTKDGGGGDARQRTIEIDPTHRPEYLLETQITAEGEMVIGDHSLLAWDGTTWSPATLTGGTAISVDQGTSTIEWQVPRADITDPSSAWLGVVSVGRQRASGAIDLFGPALLPETPSDPAVLSSFVLLPGGS